MTKVHGRKNQGHKYRHKERALEGIRHVLRAGNVPVVEVHGKEYAEVQHDSKVAEEVADPAVSKTNRRQVQKVYKMKQLPSTSRLERERHAEAGTGHGVSVNNDG